MDTSFPSRYFWDIDTSQFDPLARPTYVITRIFDMGNIEAVKWVQKTYSKEQIAHAVKTSRNLSPKSASFWALVYDISKEDLKCFQTPYRQMRKQLWPY